MDEMGNKTNVAYYFGNKCTKNCCNRPSLVQGIVENAVTCFLKDSVHFNESRVSVINSWI